jgi:hypothetical protein
MVQVLWFLLGLGLGLALDWVLVRVMLRSVKARVLALEKVQEKESVMDWWLVQVWALFQEMVAVLALVLGLLA